MTLHKLSYNECVYVLIAYMYRIYTRLIIIIIQSVYNLNGSIPQINMKGLISRSETLHRTYIEVCDVAK